MHNFPLPFFLKDSRLAFPKSENHIKGVKLDLGKQKDKTYSNSWKQLSYGELL